MNLASEQQNHGQSPGIIDLQTIWERKWLLLFSLLTTLSLGYFYLTRATPIYEVEARVLLQRQGLLDQEEHGREDKNFLATQAEIIRSPFIVQRALESTESSLRTASEVLSALNVRPLDDTNVLKVGLRDRDPQLANQLLRSIIETFAQHVRESERSSNSQSVRVLVQREQESREKLAALHTQYQQFRKDSPLIGLGKDPIAIPIARLKDLSNRLNETKARRLGLENKIQMFSSLANSQLSADAVETFLTSFANDEPGGRMSLAHDLTERATPRGRHASSLE